LPKVIQANHANRHLDLKTIILQLLNHRMGGSDKIRTCWPRFNLIE